MKTILCITDFPLSSEATTNYAFELAQLLSARLLLFHRQPAPAIVPGVLTHSQLMTALDDHNETAHKLEAVRQRLTNQNPDRRVTCDIQLKHGAAKETIPVILKDDQIVLVVVGMENAQALTDIFNEPVTAVSITASNCPVLVVPEQATFKPLQKILFVVNKLGEPYQDVALVLQLAHLFHTEIYVLHVLPESDASAAATAQEEIYPLAAWQTYPHVTYHVLLNNSVEEGISQFARENRVDMLVVGYHPDHPWQHLQPRYPSPERGYHTYLPVLFTHYKRHELP
ncbi:universal stress protein [Pontibacter chitinilyticus]|uniref:universal stress protein n=1 Tax=Pontibacter chitinilyticus TaxID=2674989 RepID=UPI0032198EBD